VRAEDIHLNLGAFEPRSVVNGPGERCVLWVQGCARRCPGCVNQPFHSFRLCHAVSVDRLARHILALNGIEGVTFTGGEPMHQARALAMLAERVQAAGRTVVCYTGDTLEALRSNGAPWRDRLLCLTDILIDGPYIQEQAGNFLWRGSRNQRIRFLTDAYRHLADTLDTGNAQVGLAADARGFTITGTWPREFFERLEEKLGS